VEWRIAPGERTGILGANGAGKSTLLGLIAGTVKPDSGRVKRGKTVKLAMLDQQAGILAGVEGDMVREVLAQLQTNFQVDGKDITPAQLLERLGFRREHLSARVRELSGGQRRRLQLLLTILSEPNVLILDEPTNDVDTDMLAATEDLLDSWPGTLIVVSHDRYLLERVTDQQYAILGGRLRHLPGGVDEYLRLAKAQPAGPASNPASSGGASSGADLYTARKELAATERKIAKIGKQISGLHATMAAHDTSDYEGLAELTAQLRALEAETTELEDRWLALSEAAE
jgi:ABC-type multidrug transport system ATPase subunit